MAEYTKEDAESMGEYLRENGVSWKFDPPWVWKCRCPPEWGDCFCVAPRYKIDNFSLDCHWRIAENEDWDFSDACAKDRFGPSAACRMLFNACRAVGRVKERKEGKQ